MGNSQFRPRAIEDLITEQDKFLIPDYQRGYRWEEQQVIDLLNDIWEFREKPKKTEKEFYCLQPIVVCKVKDDTRWELIDGQQRLITIFLIIRYINKEIFNSDEPVFSLEFATRPDSQSFLQNIDLSRNEENIDYYFICKAYEAIKSWFPKHGITRLVATQLYPVLLANTKILWYEVNDELNPEFDSKEVFTRLNMGKIPLTNAELIKALFLSQDNFDDSDPDAVRMKQFEIAGEWEKIEYNLRDNEFWYFFNNEDSASASRIEFLFDLLAQKKPKHDPFHTFNHFSMIFKKRMEKAERTILHH